MHDRSQDTRPALSFVRMPGLDGERDSVPLGATDAAEALPILPLDLDGGGRSAGGGGTRGGDGSGRESGREVPGQSLSGLRIDKDPRDGSGAGE